MRRFEFFQPIAVFAAARYCGAATTYSLLSPKSREPRNTRNTRKDDIAVEGFISVCSVCSVVKKNGICFTLKDGTGNADVPRAALRFALGYLILPLWGGDITTLSCGDCPRFLAIPCSDSPRGIRIHERDCLLTILTVIQVLPIPRP